MGLLIDTDVLVLAERSKAALDLARYAEYGNAYIKGDLAAVISPAIRMRNTNRYDGSSNINETLVDAIVKWAERIQAETELWFSKNHPLALKP